PHAEDRRDRCDDDRVDHRLDVRVTQPGTFHRHVGSLRLRAHVVPAAFTVRPALWRLHGPRRRTTRQGLPAASTSSGTSRVTTLPAPITLLAPIVTPASTIAPPPTQTSSPTVIGSAYSRPVRRSR